MVKAYYSLHGELGELRSLDGTGEVMQLSVTPALDGTLSLGGRAAEVKAGACQINVSSLPVGTHTPRLTCDRGKITLEPLVIERGRVSAPPTPDTTVRAALVRLARAEENIKILEERIAELTVMIKGNGLFG